eukprot:3855636-Amphidinium_carterae.1
MQQTLLGFCSHRLGDWTLWRPDFGKSEGHTALRSSAGICRSWPVVRPSAPAPGRSGEPWSKSNLHDSNCFRSALMHLTHQSISHYEALYTGRPS